jgi:hypothetical protein
MEESTSSRGEEGWENGPILQTNVVQLTETISLAHFNKTVPAAWFLGLHVLWDKWSLKIEVN